MMSWKHVWENHICLFLFFCEICSPTKYEEMLQEKKVSGEKCAATSALFHLARAMHTGNSLFGTFSRCTYWPTAARPAGRMLVASGKWWHQPPFYQNDQIPYHRAFSKPLCMGAGRENMKESVLKKATKQTCSFPSSLKEEPVLFPCPKVFWWWWEPGWLIFSTWRVEGFLCTCCPWCACGGAGGRSELRGSTSRCPRALPAARPWGHQSLRCAQDMVRTCARLPPGDGTSLPSLSYISPSCLGQGGK